MPQQTKSQAQLKHFHGNGRMPNVIATNSSRPWNMNSSSGDDEAPKDPRTGGEDFTQQFTENDFEGHRAHTVYVGVHVPGGRRHSQRRRKHHHGGTGSAGVGAAAAVSGSLAGSTRDSISDKQQEVERPATPPAQRVQFILGEDVDDGSHVSHPLFSEMGMLVKEGDEIEWKETARWIKFEEDVEEGGNRWSKPHVATLSLHSLFELRGLLANGSVMLDMEANNLEVVADLVCDQMVSSGTLPAGVKDKVKDALLRRHRHQHEYAKKTRLPIIRSLADMRNQSSSKIEEQSGNALLATTPLSLTASEPGPPGNTGNNGSSNALAMGMGRFLTVPGKPSNRALEDMVKSPSSQSMARQTSGTELAEQQHKGNTHFMRKIPPGAEASNILVGEVDFLERQLSCFIRLSQAAVMGDLTEVPVPTRFIFILLGPPGSQSNFHEIGRAMATLMSDEIFHEVAYRARKRDHLLAGVDEFLDAVTVLPPGEWDPTIRIEPPAAIPSQEVRKRPPELPKEEIDEEEEEQRLREESGLSRSGRLFGGLINDFKRKIPWYLSDYKDALSMQCVASWIFLYFACLSPIITFGGLLSEATGKNMAAMESLVSGFVCGMGYGFFSGQPLTILGSTGPVLVFESIVYEFSMAQGWDYMTFRFWIGMWVAVICVVLVAIDASALVCYITRFTEENFATLIAVIFVYKAIENVVVIGKTFPVNQGIYDCICTPPLQSNASVLEFAKYKWDSCESYNGTLVGHDCGTPPTENVFLMSVVLCTGTFILSTILKEFKNALFFPSIVRQYISDFSVLIAIFAMTFFDYSLGVPTQKLEVPHELKPTLNTRGWLIPPFTEKNPWWSPIIAVFPAMLGTILIFMDQQITAVIVNRKENKLKKGCGYHLDLFVLSGLIAICSMMGLPWFVAATVLSINHVNSLKLESECSAPGEKPQFLGVREQRVTHIMIFLTIGGSVLLTPLLGNIPMPVLFGVFLYMGVASLKGLQFFDRILIMFMPAKYQPDYMFLRQVPIKRVHLFTIIQLACLIILWLIKSFPQTSILFPLMLVVMIGIRKSLDFVFTRRELKILDDIMPEMTKRAAADDLHQLDAEDNHHQPASYNNGGNPGGGSGATTIHIPLSGNKLSNNGNVPAAATPPLDVNRTAVWQQINKDGTSEQLIIPVTVKVRQINGNHSSTNAALSPRLSPMHEADEYIETNNKMTAAAPTMPTTTPTNLANNCKEASGKLDAAAANTQNPANITPV
ncbi:electroneutral sodium bicarbonate exchanger 1 isoform X1 [Drosophila sulfurigaster albostrigata]|uniref:electroneutral sodium bicarbonate exchanger 1 isoform X1 n=2 Tax=Drosophila sulfurigaster albostrigata TaxID=89887 RepID=UPI002D21897E|nr:electroneutral sodium bicarbonate exchanger 1 isoform X1 [Drosophila sulfurigaster albostrigata]